MISAVLATPFGARVVGFPTGLTGTVGVRILDNVGGITLARTTAGIAESPAGSGSYFVSLTSPSTAGEYAVMWDTGTTGPSTTASTELIVSAASLLGDLVGLTSSFETTVQSMPTGLTGTIGVRVLNNATGATVLARATAGIAEFPAGSGFYTATLTSPSAEGNYSAFWDTGVVSPSTTAAEDITVASSATVSTGIDLCTLADVRQFLELMASDTSRDALIQSAITGASQHIISEHEREFAPAVVSETRTLKLNPGRRINGSVLLDLCPYDLRVVDLFRLDPEGSSPTTLVAGTDYALSPVDTPQGVYTSVRLKNSLAYSSTLWQNFGYAQVEITGAWGFANVPTDVRDACVETVASWLRRDASAFNIEGIEDPRSLAPNPALVYSLPPSALKKLRPYKRHAGVF